VYLFATMHPMPIVGKPSAPSLPSEMLLTLFLSLISFTLLYFSFVRSRYRYAIERDIVMEAGTQHA
jgi:heme exporter protein C